MSDEQDRHTVNDLVEIERESASYQHREAQAATQRAERAESACVELRQTLKFIRPGALTGSCFHGPDHPDADPSFHCCDWNQVVERIDAALATEAGAELLAEMEALRAFRERLRRYAESRRREHESDNRPIPSELNVIVAALDALDATVPGRGGE